jgi:hypothetical protein
MSITIICDHPSHARGKVAKVVTFTRNERSTWDYTVGNAARRRADSSSLFVCSLCGAHLPLWAEERRVMFQALDWLAAHGRVNEQGCVEATLTELLASRLTARRQVSPAHRS